MRSPHRSTPSATSLPRAPRDEADARVVRYIITMGIRVACFVAMVLVQPLGWYTWVFALGAVFLPYFAVVVANVGADRRAAAAVAPERAVQSAPPAEPPAAAPPSVIRITESPRSDTGPEAAR